MAAEKEEQKTGRGCCGCGSCGESGHGAMCGGLWGHQHWGHMLIKVAIILFVFGAGVEFGELKAMLHSGEYGQGPSMMRGFDQRAQYRMMPVLQVGAPEAAPRSATTSAAR